MRQKEHILITGASQRVGLHCAKALQQDGYQVIITYRTAKPSIAELEQLGVHCIACDFDQADSIVQLVQAVQELTPSLRAVVHNASLWLIDAEEDSCSIVQRLMHIHVNVPYLLNQALLPLLEKTATAASDIIHITDYVAEKGAERHIAYAASKAALANLTLSFAKQLAPAVKVNNIAPSLLMFHPDDSDDYRQKTLQKSLMANEPGADEVYHAIKLILASNYMTGRTIKLDGGRHLK